MWPLGNTILMHQLLNTYIEEDFFFFNKKLGKSGFPFTCIDVAVSGRTLCVLSRNLMDAVTGHVTFLGWDLKITRIVGGGRMKAVLFTFISSMGLFAF